eukprot:IDg8591t1
MNRKPVNYRHYMSRKPGICESVALDPLVADKYLQAMAPMALVLLAYETCITKVTGQTDRKRRKVSQIIDVKLVQGQAPATMQ